MPFFEDGTGTKNLPRISVGAQRKEGLKTAKGRPWGYANGAQRKEPNGREGERRARRKRRRIMTEKNTFLPDRWEGAAVR